MRKIRDALIRNDSQNAKALVGRHAGSAVHNSPRWRATAGILSILSLCASLNDLFTKIGTPQESWLIKTISVLGAGSTTAGAAGLAIIGPLETFLKWHSKLGEDNLFKLGGYFGLATAIGGLFTNGLTFWEAHKTGDRRNMWLSGAGVVGNFGFVIVSIRCLRAGEAVFATGPLGLAVLAILIAQGVLEIGVSVWDAAQGISVTEVNRALVSLMEGIATSTAGARLQKTDADAKRILDKLLDLAKTGWLPLAERSDANVAELEGAGLRSELIERILPISYGDAFGPQTLPQTS